MLGIKCRQKIRFKYMLWFYYLGQVWRLQGQVGVCLIKQHVESWGVRHILCGKNARKNLRVSLSGPSGPFFMLQQTWPIEWPLLGPVNDTLQLILFLPCFRFSKCVQRPTLHCFSIHQSTFAQEWDNDKRQLFTFCNTQVLKHKRSLHPRLHQRVVV